MLIGLCSPAMGSGKSTVADYLVRHHGFSRVALATPFKMITTALLSAAGLRGDEIHRRVHGDMKEAVIDSLGVSSRQIQQRLGTEFGRKAIHEDFWVRIAMSAARSELAGGRSVVIDDVRFPNEHAAIINAGGTVYRIIRPGAAVTSQHESEGQLDRIRMPEIVNDGTVEELCQRFLAASIMA